MVAIPLAPVIPFKQLPRFRASRSHRGTRFRLRDRARRAGAVVAVDGQIFVNSPGDPLSSATPSAERLSGSAGQYQVRRRLRVARSPYLTLMGKAFRHLTLC